MINELELRCRCMHLFPSVCDARALGEQVNYYQAKQRGRGCN